MALRTAHGVEADSLLRCETLPADELPLGVPGVQALPHVEQRHERRPNGTFAPGCKTVQAAGGRTSAGRTNLTARLGLGRLAKDSKFRPYRAAASTFRRVQCAELARSVGGGVCGPGPSSIVSSAALTLAWSRYFSDEAARTGDPDMAIRAARLGDQSRQSLLTAHELCAREAEARARIHAVDPIAALRARMIDTPPEPEGRTP